MTDQPQDVTPRRTFLGRLAAGALVLGGASGLGVASAVAEPARRARNPFDESWLDRIKGKHKQVFDATAINEGMPLIWPHVYLITNHEAYDLDEKDVSAVVIARHEGLAFALNDRIWEKYKIGEMFKVTDPKTNAPATRNIFAHKADTVLPWPEAAQDSLAARGVIFAACNVALTVYSGMAAQKMGGDPKAAHDEWAANLLPGVAIAPSGVLAVSRAQEKGCTYCYAGG